MLQGACVLAEFFTCKAVNLYIVTRYDIYTYQHEIERAVANVVSVKFGRDAWLFQQPVEEKHVLIFPPSPIRPKRYSARALDVLRIQYELTCVG
jgi:hypothetical protein